MKLIVGGGIGEHGRNCFLIEGEDLSVMVDCGVMAANAEPWPRISAAQAAQTKFLFLTHSHVDHTGALEHFKAQGFCGQVIASRETLMQLSLEGAPNCLELEAITPACRAAAWNGMEIYWGRSGHCAGSVWLRLGLCGKKVLFSGDYTENTLVYACDLIRGQAADLALLDCAYGAEDIPYRDCCRALQEYAGRALAAQRLLILPVPKYGRGLELLAVLIPALEDTHFMGDTCFVQNLKRMRETPFWYRDAVGTLLYAEEYCGQKQGVLFLSDPQLRAQKNRSLVGELLKCGAKAIMTGTVEKDSFSSALVLAGQMALLRYPVHQGLAQYNRLLQTNHFGQTLCVHTAAYPAVDSLEF